MHRTSLLATVALIVPFFLWGCGRAGTHPTTTPTSDAGAVDTGFPSSIDGGTPTSDVGAMIPTSDAGAVDTGSPSPLDSGSPTSDAGAMTFPKRVLLYHFSTLAIASVPAQITFLRDKLTEWGYESDDTIDPTTLSDDNLANYAAVAMINTCFEPFGVGRPDRPQSEALQRYLQKGGGLFGTHCAAVTFQSANPPVLYNQIIGGRGGSNNFMGTSTCTKAADHPSTAMLPVTLPYNGNLDEADFVAADSTVLVRCRWSGNGNREVATSWFRIEGPGRVFYTNFAKEDVDLKDATLGTQHIVPGLAWVLHR